MSGLLYMILTMSLAGSLLAAVLLLGESMWGRRMRLSWQYYLWLIVFARLLIPVSILAPAPDLPELQVQAAAADPGQQLSADVDLPGLPAAPAAPAYADWLAAVEGRSEEAWPQVLVQVLALVWIGGAVGLAVQRLTAYRSFVRCLRAGMEPVADTELLDCAADLAGQLHIRQPVEICVNPLASSPMLIGWKQPCIVFPELPDSRKEFECSVLHELVHWKRCDHIYKWIVQAAVCVHWFNPLIHYVCKRTSRLCELSCDEQVMHILGRGGTAAYGAALLNAMAGVHSCRAASGTLELSENKRLLKERLERMGEHTSRKPYGFVLTALLSACLLFCAACSRVYVPLSGLHRYGSMAPLEELPDISSGTTGAWAAGNPELIIESDGAWIQVMSTEEDRISTEFDADYYTVDVTEADGRTTVTCRGRDRDIRKDQKVVIYVPAQGIRRMETSLKNSLQTGQAAAAAQSFRLSRSVLQMDVEKEADYSVFAEQSMVSLQSENDFAGAQVEMELSETLLMANDALKRRLERSGSHAVLAAADPGSRIDLTASKGVVLLNSYDIRDLTDLIEEWAGRMAGTGDEVYVPAMEAAGEDVREALEGAAAEVSEALGGTPSEAQSGRQARTDGRGILGSVADGVGDILSQVGDGVGNILAEIGTGIRSEVFE